MESFEYQGGVSRTGPHSQEKFLLFFIVGGKEAPFYVMHRNGLVVQKKAGLPGFNVKGAEAAKIFVSSQGFGEPTLYFSFYFKFEQEGFPTIEVRPFTKKTNYYFKARGRFMKKKETLNLLNEDEVSRKFLERQEMLPVETLRRMISIDHSSVRKNIRHILVKH
jgi:hypothetical protein